MLGRDQEALESFQQAVNLWNRPWNYRGDTRRSRAGAYEGLGQAYHRLGQDAAAIEAYNQAIAIDPTDPNAFAGRGDVLTDRNALRRGDRRLRPGDPARCVALAGLRRPGDRRLSPGPRRGGDGRPRPGDCAGPELTSRRTATAAPPTPAGGRTTWRWPITTP